MESGPGREKSLYKGGREPGTSEELQTGQHEGPRDTDVEMSFIFSC